MIRDPTLPKTHEHPCPKCKNENAVFFQAQSRRAEVNFKFLFKHHFRRKCVYITFVSHVRIDGRINKPFVLIFCHAFLHNKNLFQYKHITQSFKNINCHRIYEPVF